MIHTQTPEKLAQQQKLDRELAAVLMAISVTTRSNRQEHPSLINAKTCERSQSV